MCHKYSKSYFHDAEQLRRFVDDCKEKFTTSAGGQIVELDFHIAVKINSSALSNGCTIDEPDTISGDTHKVNDNKITSFIFYPLFNIKIDCSECIKIFRPRFLKTIMIGVKYRWKFLIA